MDNSGNAGSSTEPPKAGGATTAEPVSNRSGCGCTSSTKITVRVTPTTGGQFDLQVAKTESVENLKKFISKKLKVPKERICLLHRDRQLRDGTLQENQLMDGSRLTLLPSVETGLLAQRPEQSVMQALESLNDSQVNDFLSGKAPLNLTMRLGDHMMLIQLQLSTVTPSSSRRSATASSSAPATSSSSKPAHTFLSSSQQQRRLKAAATTPQTSSASVASQTTTAPDASPSTTTDSITTCDASQPPPVSTPAPDIQLPLFYTPAPDAHQPTSPVSTSAPTSTPASRTAAPYSPSAPRTPSPAIRFTPPPKPFTSFYSPSAAPKTPIPSSHSPLETTTTTGVGAAPKGQATTPAVFVFSGKSSPSKVAAPSASSAPPPRAVKPGSSPPCKCEPPAGAKPTLDTRALAEASRNLTQTLKQLSSEVLTSRADPAEDTARARRQGAIIESMHHHGKGVYSGTFSGTLNPALQDRFGRPKRDISTIIHILNDLLCATPQYRRHARQGHTFTVEASSGSPPKQTTTNTATVDKSPVASDESTEETNSLSLENQATRGKMEHLRLIMEERRARRRARREARVAPYTTQWSAKSESLSQAGTSHEPMDTDPSPSEQQLCELNPPEPVVA